MLNPAFSGGAADINARLHHSSRTDESGQMSNSIQFWQEVENMPRAWAAHRLEEIKHCQNKWEYAKHAEVTVPSLAE